MCVAAAMTYKIDPYVDNSGMSSMQAIICTMHLDTDEGEIKRNMNKKVRRNKRNKRSGEIMFQLHGNIFFPDLTQSNLSRIITATAVLF